MRFVKLFLFSHVFLTQHWTYMVFVTDCNLLYMML